MRLAPSTALGTVMSYLVHYSACTSACEATVVTIFKKQNGKFSGDVPNKASKPTATAGTRTCSSYHSQ